MLPYELFFYGGIFFLTGVLAASGGIAPFFVTTGTLIVALLLLLCRLRSGEARFAWFASLVLFVVAGSFYFRLDDARFRSVQIPYGAKIAFSGVIASDPVVNSGAQQITLSITEPFNADVLLTVRAYPRFAYGDVVNGTGTIVKVDDAGYAHYLEKERIRGTMKYPTLESTGENNSSHIMSALLAVKHAIMRAYSDTLPPQEAVFMGGLTIGARGSFSAELKDAMQKSGTTHLVALSGYNITILVAVALGIFLLFFPRRISFVLATLVIIAFVIMTGAEASVVRAGIVGFLVLLARDIGRAHDFRNVILCAAVLMVLANPKVLAFDAGFQLSFLALIGIVYLRPALMKIFGMKEEDTSFLSWKDNMLTTSAAQLATLPILITNFGIISPVSVISNIAILELVPTTMALGFLTAGASFISHYLAQFLGLLASVFLKIELGLIYFFARISFPVHIKIGAVIIALYYLVLGIITWRYTKWDDRKVV